MLGLRQDPFVARFEIFAYPVWTIEELEMPLAA
jgi:hypothetical protein